MSNQNNIAPDRIRTSVGYDLTHVQVLASRASRAARREAAGIMFGLNLDSDKVETSLTQQIGLVCSVAAQKSPFNYSLHGVVKVIWPLVLDVFRAERSGNGTTVVLRLEKSDKTQSAKLKGGTGPEKPVVVQEVSELIEQIQEVGLASGIALGDFGVDAGGNFDVLSATAEWNGDTCFVYHSAQLTNDQLVLVAALNIQGASKQLFGHDPSVMKSAVIANGTTLLG